MHLGITRIGIIYQHRVLHKTGLSVAGNVRIRKRAVENGENQFLARKSCADRGLCLRLYVERRGVAYGRLKHLAQAS